jgi:hypothetical protein
MLIEEVMAEEESEDEGTRLSEQDGESCTSNWDGRANGSA